MSQKSTAYAGSNPGLSKASAGKSQWHSTNVRSGASGDQPMDHHVVGVQADQQVRPDLQVDDVVRRYFSGQPGDRDTAAAAVQRHRLDTIAEVLGAAEEQAVTEHRDADLGVRDQRELGVNRWTVEALVVVLDDQLPVRLDRVAVGLGDLKLSEAKGSRMSSRPTRYSLNGGASPDMLTIDQPFQSSRATGTSECSVRSVTSPSWVGGTPRRSPSGVNTHAWYGQRIRLPLASAPAGSSSCPRCRQEL